MWGMQVVLFALFSPGLPLLPYYIQTDEGHDRFFQFSSGEGGQYRRETVLGNGTVTGSYSWKDDEGMVRFYLYTADQTGYRVQQVNIVEDGQEDQVNSVEKKEGRRKSRKQNYDPRGLNSLQKEKKKDQKLKKKVLVKKKKNSLVGMKSSGSILGPHVIVKRLGLAAEVVPYIPPEARQQPEKGGLQVLYASQREEKLGRSNQGRVRHGRRGPRRGWNRRQRFMELPNSRRGRVAAKRRQGLDLVADEADLPTTRLLGKVKVGNLGNAGNADEVGNKSQVRLGRTGRMLKRRRRIGRRRKRKSSYQTSFP